MKDYVNIITLRAEELYQDLDASARLIEVNDLVRRLQKDHKKQKQIEISDAIKEAEDLGDYARVEELLSSYNVLIKE